MLLLLQFLLLQLLPLLCLLCLLSLLCMLCVLCLLRVLGLGRQLLRPQQRPPEHTPATQQGGGRDRAFGMGNIRQR